jgi:3-hydroxyisobutyrate dehydrogenase-like beta-hydroxyacid dehydrogenase/ADP-ribose pyrophosphatase YjhB (NUDIX family)
VTSVAWIGLGAMGAPMARRLVASGHAVRVWNRTRRRADALVADGAAAAASPADAARDADVAVTMVADAEALRAVVLGPDGLAAGMRADATLIEMSTVGPAAMARLRALLPAGAGVLDAPVIGSVAEAGAGRLRILVGGDEAVFRRWSGLLSVLGTPERVGPHGAGAAAKLVANGALLGALAVLAEAIALGDALGLEREATFAALAASPLAEQAGRRRAAIESRGSPPRFRLGLARKDAALAAGAAAAASRRLPVAEAVRDWLADADARGLGGADYTALLAHVAGSPWRRPPDPAASAPVADETRAGVGAIVRLADGRVLLQRRRVERRWAPPSGSVTTGESVRDAVTREVFEETGLRVAVERLVGVYSEAPAQIVRSPEGPRVHYVTCVFLCRAASDELRATEEAIEQAWFDPFALPEDLLDYAERWLHDGLRGAGVAVR